MQILHEIIDSLPDSTVIVITDIYISFQIRGNQNAWNSIIVMHKFNHTFFRRVTANTVCRYDNPVQTAFFYTRKQGIILIFIHNIRVLRVITV